MKTRLVEAGDARLHVREWGEPDGRPLLFWHALGDHTGLQMIECAPLLAGRYGFRVLAPDAPGFGGSPRLPDDRYQMPALVELAAELLDALALERTVWLGSSWGASIGVHFAGARPKRVDALLLLDGGYLGPADDFGASLAMIRRHWRSQPELWSHDSWEAVDADARAYFTRWSPELAESCRSAYREQDGKVVSIMGPDVYAAAIWGVLGAPPADGLARLGASGVPTLLLAATKPPEEEERRRPAREQFAELVPHGEIRLMDTMHFVLEDAPEETARAVGEWLRTLP
jgi:pimeloyl-ACP methyl ester carboxylesterase